MVYLSVKYGFATRNYEFFTPAHIRK